MDIANSKHGVPIRLPHERWTHITEGHPEMAGLYYDVLSTIDEPDKIVEGRSSEKLAIKRLARNQYVCVVYKELSNKDGFVITAFITSKVNLIERRKQLWP